MIGEVNVLVGLGGDEGSKFATSNVGQANLIGSVLLQPSVVVLLLLCRDFDSEVIVVLKMVSLLIRVTS